MLFSRFSPAAWAALLASTARGSPMPLDLPLGRPQTDLAVRGAMGMADHHLEKRLSADFSLDHSWDNEVLFSGLVAVPTFSSDTLCLLYPNTMT